MEICAKGKTTKGFSVSQAKACAELYRLHIRNSPIELS